MNCPVSGPCRLITGQEDLLQSPPGSGSLGDTMQVRDLGRPVIEPSLDRQFACLLPGLRSR